jgi:WD40 repeat protein
LWLSLLAILTLSALVAVAVWPFESRRFRDHEDVIVLQAVVDPREQQALLFLRTITRYSPSGCIYFVRLQDLVRNRSQDLTTFSAVALIDTPAGVVLAEQDGVLRRLLSPWAAGRSEVIGQQPEGVPIKLNCSADGRRLLTQSDNHFYLWDLLSSRLIRTLPRGEIVDAVLSADGERFYHACLNHNALVERSSVTGDVLRTFPIAFEPLDLTASPDGQHLAVLGFDEELRMLQLERGHWLWQQRSGQRTSAASAIGFCPRGESIVTARQADDGNGWTVEVHDTHSGVRQAAYDTPLRVLGVAITADQRVQSWGANGSFCQWNMSDPEVSGASRREFSARHTPQLPTAME